MTARELLLIKVLGKIVSFKAVGKVVELEGAVGSKNISGTCGIAHARWATHGRPSDRNSHPHSDCAKNVYLVRNGIIENYKELRDKLIKKGHKFASETDSEVVAHLIEEFSKPASRLAGFESAVIESLKRLKGTYGLAIIDKNDPGKIIAARMGSPLVIGLGHNENIIASDVSAIVRHTDKVIYLEDGELAVVEAENYEVMNIRRKRIDKKITKLGWSMKKAEKSGFPRFMLKEIFKQPRAVEDTIRGRLVLEIPEAIPP
jgi:glutamine---fructose-6-phosphate transaminase (isomerizing)